MSTNFRIERFSIENSVQKYIKVYAKGSKDFPLQINAENRCSILFSHAEQFLDRIHNFAVREDDVWVITPQKCGTTWMLELVWLLINNLDFETALRVEQEERCPFLDFCTIFPQKSSIDEAESLKSPRIIKSHLPMHCLPKGLWTVKPKIVFVARDPKDAVISLYHFHTGLKINELTKTDFVDNYINDRTRYAPFWSLVLEFWKIRTEPYIWFTSFEQMKKDLRSVILQISRFLGQTINERKIEELLDHLSFDKMKDNPRCNHWSERKLIEKILGIDSNNMKFIRKGEVGSHRGELEEKTIAKIEEWTQRSLKPLGLTLQEILYS